MERKFLSVYKRKAGSVLSHTPQSHPLEFEEIFSIKNEGEVDAGTQSAPIEIFVRNITGFLLKEVRLFVLDSDVKIIPEVIPTMTSDEYARVEIIWKPRPKRVTPLDTKIMARAKIVKRVN